MQIKFRKGAKIGGSTEHMRGSCRVRYVAAFDN